MLIFLNQSTTQQLIREKFINIKIAVIGDLMLDRYIWGSVSRISPEAPVPVVRVNKKTVSLGGAGNVACNLATLGCQVHLLGIVGADIEAEILTREMLNLNIITDGIVTDPNRPTTVKTRIISHSQQMLRLDDENTGVIDSDMEQNLLERSINKLDDVNLVILSDYGKGVLTDHFLKVFLPTARQKGVRVLVDPKRTDYTAYTGAAAITPNRPESELAIKHSLISDEDFEFAAQEFQQKYALEAVLITRSERGMTLFWNGKSYHFQTQAREVFDVSGAGDSVIAILGAGLSAGLSWTEAVELANLGAGIAVQKVGTAPVHAEELLQVIEQEGISASNGKILQLSDLMRQIAAWRVQGKKIVFTNGCFDILHIGHVVYLEKARAMGDVLIVGLNTDQSVKRLKGAERPLVSEADRARVLAALSSVSAVVLFDQDTPIKLIEAIKPDILVKGADYQEEEVVGADFVRSYQGQVALIPLVKDRSTTQIINKFPKITPNWH
ncbi:MAG: D-glycero-beta-D-manno-heptose-7-phosphate kinase [bacterium]|jgi:D-beta-D-heptose 7-phosphate kinase/D-beta-D-heptose 1-phosphate adenosyltransferase